MTTPICRSENDGGIQGIHAQMRLIVSHDAAQRFDADGRETLEFRGHVVDDGGAHPQVVVRFRGRQQDELYRWAQPGKHVLVQGALELKQWTTADGKQHAAYLVHAENVHPLRQANINPSHSGVYAALGKTVRNPAAPPRGGRLTRAQRAEQMRLLMETTSNA